MAAPIYKICTEASFQEAEAKGRFDGSADDTRDGFIHLSTADQLEGTLARHFAGQDQLLLLAVDPGALGDALRWEVSRGGALFPHLYAPLDLEAVLFVEPLELQADGVHRLPAQVIA